MPRETQRYETKSTPHFSSWPFQSEDGLPQSTQTSRLNPSSLFEQRPDKACLAESAPGPSGHGNGRIPWAMGAGEVCAGLSWPLLCPSGGGRYWVLRTCVLSCSDVFMPWFCCALFGGGRMTVGGAGVAGRSFVSGWTRTLISGS